MALHYQEIDQLKWLLLNVSLEPGDYAKPGTGHWANSFFSLYRLSPTYSPNMHNSYGEMDFQFEDMDEGQMERRTVLKE